MSETSPKETSKEEKIRQLDNWIKQGLELIKKKEFSKAIQYYEDEQMAEKIGFGYTGVFEMPIDLNNYTKEQLQQLVDMCTSRCKISLRTDRPITPEFIWSGGEVHNPRPKVGFARITTADFSTELIPAEINQQIALAHATEWINALQMINRGPLSGSVPDSSVDVQLYLMENGVEVPEKFAIRHEGGYYHPNS